MEKIKTSIVKRIFDIIFSIILIIISSPLWALIICLLTLEQAIRFNIPMPIYSEKRVSLGKAFNFFKFNIFKPRVIRDFQRRGEHIFTKQLEHDGHSPTIIGHLVQRIYLDELPQLWCVLIGKMSLVGPRPRDLVQYEKGLSQGNNVLAIIKAGLAGTYQANKGEPGAGQHKLDMEYIDFVRSHNSWQIILNDISIIFRTIWKMFKAQGF